MEDAIAPASLVYAASERPIEVGQLHPQCPVPIEDAADPGPADG